jgi:5-dehydro-2-deoxygluconokinase
VTGTALAGEPSRTAAFEALALARTFGTFSILDIDYRQVSWPSEDETARVVADAAHRCDVVIGNDQEFAMLSRGGTDPLETAGRFARNGCRFVILKKGNAGSTTITRDAVFDTDIFAVDAKKPFGSGDAFLGSLVVALRRGATVQDAVRRATAAAAYVVARRGCAFAMPTASELETFIQGYSPK